MPNPHLPEVHSGRRSPVLDLRATLRDRALVGSFLKLPRRESVDVLAMHGFDFAICDMEHGQVTEREACDVIVAGAAVGLAIVVRVPGGDPGVINRLLEWGAAGVQVPRITSAAAAQSAELACRYPPVGTRSASLAQPAAGYGRLPADQYLAESNSRVLTVGQLETVDYEDDLVEIVRHLDVAFIGTFDLSIDAGQPGRPDHRDVQPRVRAVEEAARDAGTPIGSFTTTADGCRKALAAGHRYVAVGSDLAMLSQGAAKLGRQLGEVDRP